MKMFVRVALDAANKIIGFEGQETPFDTVALADIDGLQIADLGLVDLPQATETTQVVAWLRENISAHPVAGTHQDAPLVSIKSAARDAISWTPCRDIDVIAHLETRGDFALPDAALMHLRGEFTQREICSPRALRALGLSFSEIRALPKFQAALARQKEKANAPIIAALAVAATEKINRANAARFHRRVEKAAARHPKPEQKIS
jgi:hypothetical protein